MPTYEYKCRDCGELTEAVQSFTDDPLTVCPRCEGELRKVFSPVGISFKGSGFYKTDSRSGSGTKKASTASSEGTSTKDSTNGSDSSSGDKASGDKASGDKKAGSSDTKASATSGSSSD